jgi:hypothetical protein
VGVGKRDCELATERWRPRRLDWLRLAASLTKPSNFACNETPAFRTLNYGATAIPHGPSGTLIVAVTRPDAVSITETSFDNPFAV